MTVHMIQIQCENPSNTTVETVRQEVDLWCASYSETLHVERRDIRLSPASEFSTTPEHLVGHFRFLFSDDKATLLADIEQSLWRRVKWYRIRYHECTHDGEFTPCSWDETRTRGTVPAGL